MRGFKSLVLRTRDLIPTHLYSLLWVIRQQTIIEKYYFDSNTILIDLVQAFGRELYFSILRPS